MRSPDVKTDMSIRSDASKKESNASQRSNPIFKFLAPLVDPMQQRFLFPLQWGLAGSAAQTQINGPLRPYRVQRLVRAQSDLIAVD